MDRDSHSEELKRPVRCDLCNRLLGAFEVARGEIKCPKCKHVQRIDIEGPYRRRAAND